jgi:amino acid transporter
MTSPAIGADATSSAVVAGRLHRRLGSVGLTLLALSCLSPVLSIYGVGSDVLQHVGTGAASLFILGISAALVWSVVYAELGSAYPYAGGDYVGVGTILGGWAGVVTLAIVAVTAGPSSAFEAKIISTYVADLAPNAPPALITFAAMGAAVAIGLLAVRWGALVTGLFLAVEMLAVLALLVAGFVHPARGLGTVLVHPMTLGASGLLVPAALSALALGGVSAVYGTVGGNQAIYFGEELEDPHRRMGRVILVAGLIGAFATSLPEICPPFCAAQRPSPPSSPRRAALWPQRP